MVRLRSRRLKVGPAILVVESDDTEIYDEFVSLFAGFDDAAPGGSASILSIRVVEPASDAHDRRYRAALDGEFISGPAERYQLALTVTRKLNRMVLDAEPEVLHLHAGAVRSDHTSLLVIGSSFSGKSTLVAKLVSSGWRYLSDEQVGVSTTGEIVPYPRPITLRRDSWPMFESLQHVDLPAVVPAAVDRLEVSPTVLGEIDRNAPAAPTLIICPDAAAEHFYVAPLTVAETLGFVVSDSLDLERAAEAGIQAMLSLTAAAPAYRIGGKDMGRKLAAIDELAGSAAPPGRPLEQAAVPIDEVSCRVVGTEGWLFPDGSSALYEPLSGTLVRLDEDGFRAWQMLGAPKDSWPDGLAGSGFVAELTAAGVLGVAPG